MSEKRLFVIIEMRWGRGVMAKPKKKANKPLFLHQRRTTDISSLSSDASRESRRNIRPRLIRGPATHRLAHSMNAIQQNPRNNLRTSIPFIRSVGMGGYRRGRNNCRRRYTLNRCLLLRRLLLMTMDPHRLRRRTSLLLLLTVLKLLLLVPLDIGGSSWGNLDSIGHGCGTGYYAACGRSIVEDRRCGRNRLGFFSERIKFDSLRLQTLSSVCRGRNSNGSRALTTGCCAKSWRVSARWGLVVRTGKAEKDVRVGVGPCDRRRRRGPGRGRVGVCSGEGGVDGADVVDGSGHGEDLDWKMKGTRRRELSANLDLCIAPTLQISSQIRISARARHASHPVSGPHGPSAGTASWPDTGR
ncbi:hypothetical protein AN958_09373 [Leucoagaricus sp. SymC.cos]|nr:hypothetical protein AN958_09373 [Leucoagaricus sp. SymC.cos]